MSSKKIKQIVRSGKIKVRDGQGREHTVRGLKDGTMMGFNFEVRSLELRTSYGNSVIVERHIEAHVQGPNGTLIEMLPVQKGVKHSEQVLGLLDTCNTRRRAVIRIG
jgi:hypothetical protein